MSDTDLVMIPAHWVRRNGSDDDQVRRWNAPLLTDKQRELLRRAYAKDDALAAELAEAEARSERLADAVSAAEVYIGVLDRGIGPSRPEYLAGRDVWRNAREDLHPGDLDEQEATR